jgi:hypothetical protein
MNYEEKIYQSYSEVDKDELQHKLFQMMINSKNDEDKEILALANDFLNSLGRVRPTITYNKF